MEIFLKKLFSKIRRETKKGRKGRRKKRERERRKEEDGEKQTRRIEKQKEKGKNQAPVFEFLTAPSLLLEYTHIQNTKI